MSVGDLQNGLLSWKNGCINDVGGTTNLLKIIFKRRCTRKVDILKGLSCFILILWCLTHSLWFLMLHLIDYFDSLMLWLIVHFDSLMLHHFDSLMVHFDSLMLHLIIPCDSLMLHFLFLTTRVGRRLHLSNRQEARSGPSYARWRRRIITKELIFAFTTKHNPEALLFFSLSFPGHFNQVRGAEEPNPYDPGQKIAKFGCPCPWLY